MAVTRRGLHVVASAAPTTLRAELWRRGVRFEARRDGAMLVVDTAIGRFYVEERAGAARPFWIVHADGALGRADQQLVCTSPAATVDVLLGAVS